jgi:polygalacturonase
MGPSPFRLSRDFVSGGRFWIAAFLVSTHRLPMSRLLIVSFALAGFLSRAMADNVTTLAGFGVSGDGKTLDTVALQRAIDQCSVDGGGTLRIPPGRYVTGSLELKNGVTLQLAAGAVLLGSVNAADYRKLDPFTDGTGAERGYALITAMDANKVGIVGPGVIDGQGAALKAAQGNYLVRPFLVRWVRCTTVTVSDVQLRNSGAWTMHFSQSKNIGAKGVTIRCQGLPNNDGIDIDSCENVRVTDCDINTGDDAVCLKTTSSLPCRNVIVTGCKLTSRCAAIKLGTESLGDFTNIRVDHCQIRDTRLGGIKLLSVDGAQLDQVVLSDITMDNVTVPIMVRLGGRLKTFRPGDTPKTPGTLRNVTIRNIQAKAAGQIGILVSGILGHPVQGLLFENLDLQLIGGQQHDNAGALTEKESAYPEINMFGTEMPCYGIYARHVDGATFTNVHLSVVSPDVRPAVDFIDVTGLTLRKVDFDGQSRAGSSANDPHPGA